MKGTGIPWVLQGMNYEMGHISFYADMTVMIDSVLDPRRTCWGVTCHRVQSAVPSIYLGCHIISLDRYKSFAGTHIHKHM